MWVQAGRRRWSLQPAPGAWKQQTENSRLFKCAVGRMNLLCCLTFYWTSPRNELDRGGSRPVLGAAWIIESQKCLEYC